MKRNILHIIPLFIFLQVGWINILYADTIPIPEVIIQSSRETYFSSTNLNYKLDSFQSHYYGRNSIADILQNFTPVQINSYGLGGAVSIS